MNSEPKNYMMELPKGKMGSVALVQSNTGNEVARLESGGSFGGTLLAYATGVALFAVVFYLNRARAFTSDPDPRAQQWLAENTPFFATPWGAGLFAVCVSVPVVGAIRKAMHKKMLRSPAGDIHIKKTQGGKGYTIAGDFLPSLLVTKEKHCFLLKEEDSGETLALEHKEKEQTLFKNGDEQVLASLDSATAILTIHPEGERLLHGLFLASALRLKLYE